MQITTFRPPLARFLIARQALFCAAILSIFVTAAGAEDAALTQDADQDGTPVLEFGLSGDEVLRLYGAPDKKELSESKHSEKWYYGKTAVFFQDGKLSAWTYEPGDLERRYHKQATQNKPVGEEAFLRNGWKDAWRREREISREDAIDELFYLESEKSVEK